MDKQQLDEILTKLLDAIEEENCIAWAGAGLSVPADKPSWVDFIKKLCQKCSVNCSDVKSNSLPKKLMDKAEKCKNKSLRDYQGFIVEKFGKPNGGITNRIYYLLISLPFKAYITTNFDPLLYEAASDTLEEDKFSFFWYPNLPPQKVSDDLKTIFYIHGLANTENNPLEQSFVLATSEFKEAYNGATMAFLFNLFNYNPYKVIFLGTRLKDPFTRSLLQKRIVNQKQIQDSGQKLETNKEVLGFILLEPELYIKENEFGDVVERFRQPNIEFQKEARKLKELGIEVIRYDPVTKTYDELLEIIKTLKFQYDRLKKTKFNATDAEQVTK